MTAGGARTPTTGDGRRRRAESGSILRRIEAEADPHEPAPLILHQLRFNAVNTDRLEPGERCASPTNRNFVGRQGRDGRTHLVGSAMAAAAITGRRPDHAASGRNAPPTAGQDR